MFDRIEGFVYKLGSVNPDKIKGNNYKKIKKSLEKIPYLCKIDGNWLKSVILEYQGQSIEAVNLEDFCSNWDYHRVEDLKLPSDSDLREDLRSFMDNKNDESDQKKSRTWKYSTEW